MRVTLRYEWDLGCRTKNEKETLLVGGPLSAIGMAIWKQGTEGLQRVAEGRSLSWCFGSGLGLCLGTGLGWGWCWDWFWDAAFECLFKSGFGFGFGLGFLLALGFGIRLVFRLVFRTGFSNGLGLGSYGSWCSILGSDLASSSGMGSGSGSHATLDLAFGFKFEFGFIYLPAPAVETTGPERTSSHPHIRPGFPNKRESDRVCARLRFELGFGCRFGSGSVRV